MMTTKKNLDYVVGGGAGDRDDDDVSGAVSDSGGVFWEGYCDDVHSCLNDDHDHSANRDHSRPDVDDCRVVVDDDDPRADVLRCFHCFVVSLPTAFHGELFLDLHHLQT